MKRLVILVVSLFSLTAVAATAYYPQIKIDNTYFSVKKIRLNQ